MQAKNNAHKLCKGYIIDISKETKESSIEV